MSVSRRHFITSGAVLSAAAFTGAKPASAQGFECGIEGKAKGEIPKSIEYLKKQWEEA